MALGVSVETVDEAVDEEISKMELDDDELFQRDIETNSIINTSMPISKLTS